MRKLIYILMGVMLLTAGFCAVSCSQNETDRAAPEMHLVREHRAFESQATTAATLPVGWGAARGREERALAAYDDAIDSDQATFLAAKHELREAAEGVNKLMPATIPPEGGTPSEGGAR